MNLPFRITPKTYMFSFLLILTIIGVIKNSILKTLPQILIALVTTIILDVLINYIKKKKFIPPDSAVITALFIATALAIGTNWYITLIASAIAILTKHLIKINNRHIFNPANIGLLFVGLLFSSTIGWWSAQINWLVIIFGIFIAYKVKRFYIIIPYLITGLILSLIYVLITKTILSLGILFLSINLFFMFFMLTEPMTAPPRKKSQIVYGIVAAVLTLLFILFIPRIEASIGALVLSNLFTPLLNKYLV